MLKQVASVVLDSSKSSTYPWGYDSGFDSPATLLAILFEHHYGEVQLNKIGSLILGKT
jgi:hypothetical protein